MRSRTIPWLLLAFGFFWYVEAGFLIASTVLWVKALTRSEATVGARNLTLVLAGFIVLTWTGALPVAWFLAETLARAKPITKTLAGVGVVIVAGSVAVVLAIAGALAYAVAWALAWAWTGSRGGGWTLSRILAWNVIGAMALALVGCTGFGVVSWTMLGAEFGAKILGWLLVIATILTLPLAMVAVLAQVWAIVEDELPMTLSQFHTFLILAGTSLSGIGLGWLVTLICR